MPRSPVDLTVAGSTTAERVAVAWRDAVSDAATMRTANARPVAVGWATVELDRATTELAGALGLGRAQVFRPAPRSAVLGGACRVARGVLPDEGSLVVLEPDAEGRLAGSLARLGEGPVGVWLAVDDAAAALQALRQDGFAVSAERDGPFGTERLIVGGLAEGVGRQRLLVVRAPGTIRS